jgi:hypothetical protein
MRVLKLGLRLRSAVCTTEVMVIRTVPGGLDVRCGGSPMSAADEVPPAGCTLDAAQAQGTLLGKRYIDAAERLELLCTKGGAGSIFVNGEPLRVKEAKALPSSD